MERANQKPADAKGLISGREKEFVCARPRRVRPDTLRKGGLPSDTTETQCDEAAVIGQPRCGLPKKSWSGIGPRIQLGAESFNPDASPGTK